MQESGCRTGTTAPGYSIAWSGQFEYLERASKRCASWCLSPCNHFPAAISHVQERGLGNAHHGDTAICPDRRLWLIYLLGHHLSVASGVGFIALAGVSSEFGVIMLIYLNNAIAERRAQGQLETEADLCNALVDGAVLRFALKR